MNWGRIQFTSVSILPLTMHAWVCVLVRLANTMLSPNCWSVLRQCVRTVSLCCYFKLCKECSKCKSHHSWHWQSAEFCLVMLTEIETDTAVGACDSMLVGVSLWLGQYCRTASGGWTRRWGRCQHDELTESSPSLTIKSPRSKTPSGLALSRRIVFALPLYLSQPVGYAIGRLRQTTSVSWW